MGSRVRRDRTRGESRGGRLDGGEMASRRPNRGFVLGFVGRNRMISVLLFIPGASHFHQHQLLVVADITRAERAS